MKHAIACTVLALAMTSAHAQQALPKYTYSGAVDQPVVSLDYQGSRVKRINDAPTLSIFADGRVEMPRNYAHMRAYSGRISQQELQQLLDLIVREKQFFHYDPAVARAKLTALPGRQVMPDHLATTVITVNANGMHKSVRHFGLGHGRAIEETEQLLQVRDQLEQIMSVTRLGGEAEASRWLALANRELRDRHPGATPLGLDHLRSAAIHPDGSARVRFARSMPRQPDSVSVSIAVDESGISRISVATATPSHSTDIE